MSVYRFRKEELEGHLNKNAQWAIVYGDLMSYLMILFLLMLSYQISLNADIKKRDPVEESLIQIQRVFGGEIDPAVEARAQQRDKEFLLERKLKERTEEGSLGETSLIVTEKSITLNLGAGVLFDSGKAELKESAIPILETIARDMKSLKNTIRVEGHTDNVPPGKRIKYQSNWELSMARAYSVIRQLQELGVDGKRLEGVGHGEYRPIADNGSAQGRAKNRRIEISLLKEE
jgi:chemotaxis protein MotB